MKSYFAANIAENINNSKISVVKAELAISMGDMESIKRHYTLCQQENGSLIGEYQKRRANHESLVSSLKDLNGFVQQISDIRHGQAKGLCVQKCREAIKKKSVQDLVIVM